MDGQVVKSCKNQVPQKFFQVKKMVKKLCVGENILNRKNNIKIRVSEFFLVGGVAYGGGGRRQCVERTIMKSEK